MTAEQIKNSITFEASENDNIVTITGTLKVTDHRSIHGGLRHTKDMIEISKENLRRQLLKRVMDAAWDYLELYEY